MSPMHEPRLHLACNTFRRPVLALPKAQCQRKVLGGLRGVGTRRVKVRVRVGV